MDTTELPSGAIVVGVDGSDSAASALSWALEQAVAERRALVLAHAVSPRDLAWLDPNGAGQYVGVDALSDYGHELLRTAKATVEQHDPGVEVHTVFQVDDPRHLLFELSKDAAMVVLGSHGRGPVGSLLLGSVGVALSRRVRCPLTIHRQGNEGRVRHGVLVGVDGTRGSLTVLEFAFRQASLRHLPLTAQHAVWDARATVMGPHLLDAGSTEFEDERLLVAESMAGLGEKFPDVRVTLSLAVGHAADCLVLEASRMNLLVVGRHDIGALSRITRGSIATTVVEHVTCPVSVVPVPAE